MFYMFDYFMKGFKFKDTVHVSLTLLGGLGCLPTDRFQNFPRRPIAFI